MAVVSGVACEESTRPEPDAGPDAAAGCMFRGERVAPGPEFRIDCVGPPEARCCVPCACGRAPGPAGEYGITCLASRRDVQQTICTEQSYCSYGGRQYVPDAVFPAADGCNTCSCRSEASIGRVVCTENKVCDGGVDASDASDADIDGGADAARDGD